MMSAHLAGLFHLHVSFHMALTYGEFDHCATEKANMICASAMIPPASRALIRHRQNMGRQIGQLVTQNLMREANLARAR
jgi:hypothetical protein